MLPQWQVKDPGHSATSAGGRLHLNMQTLMTQRSQIGLTVPCGSLSGNELTPNLSGSISPQLSQLDEPVWTDPGIKSGISVRGLIYFSKEKKKKAQAGNEWSNILLKILASEEKATTSPLRYCPTGIFFKCTIQVTCLEESHLHQ